MTPPTGAGDYPVARSTHFEPNHSLVLRIAQEIGKTSDDLDRLFRPAASY